MRVLQALHLANAGFITGIAGNPPCAATSAQQSHPISNMKKADYAGMSTAYRVNFCCNNLPLVA